MQKAPERFTFLLKASVFATGLSGIVAEYVLSTLATYIVGNAVFQWTITMSLMLFAMGVGSRISRLVRDDLLDAFVLVEFCLSLLCACSAVVAYGLTGRVASIDAVIYAMSLCIGMLIGFEIPLVTRINEHYEELRVNIANVMEKDYYGALAGGLLFAFVALPHLGLTYTPIALGTVNFAVASLFLWRFRHLLRRPRRAMVAFALVACFLAGLAVFAKPIVMFGEQRQYKDKVIFQKQTPYQKIVMTKWKSHHWLFINGQEQFSSYDEEKYHEPLVHMPMMLASGVSDVLILGGGDGLALREVFKHETVKSVTLVDLDPAMPELAKTHPILLELNKGSMHDPRLTIVNNDASSFLHETDKLFDTVIIDLPDPDTVDLMHLYSLDFYKVVRSHLSAGGTVVTQATSPYFAPLAFLCIQKTMQEAGFATLPYHNQVPTMGEWGWVLGMRNDRMTTQAMRAHLLAKDFNTLNTRFINNDAVRAMLLFGKGILDHPKAKQVEANTRHKPVLYRYYNEARWDMY